MAGLAIGTLLLTTLVAALMAGYYCVRHDAMQAKMLQSDGLASERAGEIAYLQLKINFLERDR